MNYATLLCAALVGNACIKELACFNKALEASPLICFSVSPSMQKSNNFSAAAELTCWFSIHRDRLLFFANVGLELLQLLQLLWQAAAVAAFPIPCNCHIANLQCVGVDAQNFAQAAHMHLAIRVRVDSRARVMKFEVKWLHRRQGPLWQPTTQDNQWRTDINNEYAT
jgi:hypothetical protein